LCEAVPSGQIPLLPVPGREGPRTPGPTRKVAPEPEPEHDPEPRVSVRAQGADVPRRGQAFQHPFRKIVAAGGHHSPFWGGHAQPDCPVVRKLVVAAVTNLRPARGTAFARCVRGRVAQERSPVHGACGHRGRSAVVKACGRGV
jgi:hypothetical protein